MSKYHITENGNAALCKAEIRACPRGGEDRHFGSKQEAQQAYEAENDKNTFANYATISFDERKANVQELFAEKYPNVGIIKNTTTEKIKQKYSSYVSFRKGEEIVFKTKANTRKLDFSMKEAEKFAKDNKLKCHYIQTEGAGSSDFDKYNHAVFTAVRPLTVDDKKKAREEKIKQLQQELKDLDNS